MKTKRLWMLVLGCSLLFTGCGTAKEPKTASALVERYVKNMEDDCSYHMDARLSIDISMVGEEASVDFPVSLTLASDVAGRNTHSVTNLSTSFMGETANEQTESYTEENDRLVTAYRCRSGKWEILEAADSYTATPLAFVSMDPDHFEDAEFTFREETGTYLVTQKFLDFAKNETASAVAKELCAGAAGIVRIDPGIFLNGWKNARAVYEFDEDYNLLSVVLEGCEHSEPMEGGSGDLNACISMDLAFSFSDYGSIRKADVKVPELTKTLCNAGSDALGAYNGTPLTCGGDDWSIFREDGWELSGSGSDLSSVAASNRKYKGARLQVYNRTRSDADIDDILKGGFFGYDVKAGNVPLPMTWNGLTFGATAEEITGAYGDDHATYEDDNGVSYLYAVSKNMELVFCIDAEEGLNEVRLDYYGK